jgi:hypothetical protein
MRPLAALLAIAAIAAGATGCGADDVNPNVLAQAADATSRQKGVHIEATGTFEFQGQSIPMRLDGDTDLAGREARFTFSSEAAGEEISGEQILQGTTIYMRMDLFEQAFGTEWVKMDVQKVLEQEGLDFGGLMQLGSQNPAEQLAWLRATADLEEVGEEDVDGVQTTHYKAVIELRRVADAAPEDERDEVRRSIDRLVELSGMERVPTEVWVDDENLIRRQRMTMEQEKPQPSTTTLDMRFSDYGKRVDVDAPGGEVKDITDLTAESLREQG